MPYIEKRSQEKINLPLNSLSKNIDTVDSLNYCITKFCLKFLNRSINSYLTLNGIIGVLECVKLEFYRRLLSVYEDKKIDENGDVYI